MSDTLHNRLRSLRWRIRAAVVVFGLSSVVAVVVGAALVTGLLDWLVHVDDAGVRVLLGLAILAAGAWIGWRTLIAPLLRPLRDVDLALRIERRFPGFQEGLASTVQFLEHGNSARLGSPELQRQVIERSLRQVESVDVREVVDTRGVRQAAAIALAVCAVTALIAGFNPSEAGIALRRLAFPLTSNPWPKRTDLQLVDGRFEPLGEKLRMARGGTLELFVENRKGDLPGDVRMEYRFDDGSTTSERLQRTALHAPGGEGHQVAAARIVASRGPVEFRAVGGDDHEMPWHRLEVVAPPLIEELQVVLTPPPYTGAAVEKLPSGVGHVQGFVGTHVEVAGLSNKPLAAARLRIKDQPPVEIAFAPDSRRFRTSFEIAQPGVYSYWFELKDRDGFEDPEAPRYEIRGIADAVPDVVIEQPTTDRQVTSDAVVPLRVTARDDLGVRDVRLRFRWSESEEPAGALPLHEGADRLQQVAAEHEWALAPLSLQPGMRLTIHAEATDDFDLGPPHVGRSTSRTLTIVSPEVKRAELASRQSELIDELDAARKSQTEAHQRIAELRTQLETAGRLQPADVDLLKRVELEQRQIASRLANPVDGIEKRSRDLQDELRNNRLEDPELQRRIGQVASELGTVREEHLPALERAMTQARKASQPDAGERATGESREAIAGAERHQRAVLESLGHLLDELSDWRDQRELAGDVAEMVARQEELNRESAELGRETLTRSLSQLSPQEKADLARLAERQKGLADRLGEFSSKLQQARDKIAERNPSAAETLSDAAEELQQQATAGQMREAAEQLRQNRIGQATTVQQRSLEFLKQLQETLQNQGTPDAESLVRKLKEAEAELETLRKREEELLQKADAADEIADADERDEQLEMLRKEQQEIRDDLARMRRSLERMQVQQAAGAAERAAGAMDRIDENMARNADDPLTLQQEQERLRREVEDHLEQAQRELARERRQAEQRLARELLERISDELQAMIPRQQNVIDETTRLEAERARRGNWTRAQLKSLRDLVDVQRGLMQETDRLVDTLSAAEVFAMALQGASRSMQRAADRLEQRRTDQTTIAAEEAAKQRFVDLVGVLQEEADQPSASPQPAGEGGPDPQQPERAGPQGDAIPQLAQLRLLRLMQLELIARTAELETMRQNGAFEIDDQANLDALAEEQGKLADLARNLMQEVGRPLEIEPEDPEQGDLLR